LGWLTDLSGRHWAIVDIAIRQATKDDLGEIARLDGASFGFQYSEQDLADTQLIVDLDRFLVATEAKRIVGITGDYPLVMTLPGGAALEVPGVTWVSVLPTHRRRGILRQLMHRQLRDYFSGGVPLAILTASEGGIYGRFGYGPASSVRKTVVDRRLASLRDPGDVSAVQLAPADQARAHAPEVHRRWREQVPGALSRSDAWWDFLFLDREFQRAGMTALFFLLHPDGYVSYRVKSDWADGHARHVCWIVDYFVATQQAHAALWQVLLSMDLFGSIESHQIPIDDPLSFALTDFRQVRTLAVNDGIWVRPIDVAATLSARRYGADVDAVIEVTDDLFGDGRYLLRAAADGATCEPTDRTPNLSLSASTLGSVYLGGNRLQTLAAAGHVQCEDPALLTRLDRAFLSDRAPFHGTGF
jgi:predicted acetyltransferase